MKIEAGKYYRTRDGRKVGPMIYDPCGSFDPWEANGEFDGFGDLWSDNGKSTSGDNDLIAEWTDEPETPTWQDMLQSLESHICAQFDVCLENNDIEGAVKMVGYIRSINKALTN